MSPIKLMAIIFTLNIGAITMAIGAIKPSQARNIELSTVNIQQPKDNSRELITGKPSKLSIKTAGVEIPVIAGEYDAETGAWDLSKDKAHYATVTPKPNNQVGNTFIYGHNRVGVFNNLDNLKAGDKAIVHTQNGKKFIYRLVEIKEVEPIDVSLFKYKGPSQLTVQTCSGSWYEKRKLFIFDFTQVR